MTEQIVQAASRFLKIQLSVMLVSNVKQVEFTVRGPNLSELRREVNNSLNKRFVCEPSALKVLRVRLIAMKGDRRVGKAGQGLPSCLRSSNQAKALSLVEQVLYLKTLQNLVL